MLIRHLLIAVFAFPALALAQYERQTIDFETVAGEAAALIREEGPTPSPKLPKKLRELSYDDYRNIRFRPSEALWWNDPLPYRVEFFHLGHIFPDPIQIFEFSDTHVQEIPFLAKAFNYEKSGYSPGFMNTPPGYAGIRVKYPLNREDVFDELIVFQGASYFRALGKDQAYGLSLRGIAMNTLGDAEDFPRFTKIWLKKPNPGDESLTLYALLEGLKVTGAYAFKVKPNGSTVIDVHARLFFRHDGASEVGIAPLTSMFLYGENSNHSVPDWRPEVHDSDGLLIHTGTEWIWHPLENLPGRYSKAFPTEKLAGFGLMQRDREFTSYEDLESHYEKRPSAWITPQDDWPAGAVVLYTFGTDSEASDNVNAFWKPDLTEGNNQPLDIHYSITLQLKDPPAEVARVLETRVGQRTLDPGNTTIVIEFSRPESIDVEDVGSLSAEFDFGAATPSGEPVVQYNEAEDHIRVFAHIKDPTEPGERLPYEMAAQLLRNGQRVSERWNYTWKP